MNEKFWCNDFRNRPDDNISHMRRDISVKEEKTCKIKTKYTYWQHFTNYTNI